MRRYLFTYLGGEDGDSEREVMQAWADWLKSLGEAVVEMGAPLNPDARQIEPGGAVSQVPDAALANGYSIIQAESMAEALELAAGCPGLQWGTRVLVFEEWSEN